MATKAQVREAIEIYRDPRSLQEVSLRFFRARDGRYVIEVGLPSEIPSWLFFETVEHARDGWRFSRDNLRRRGYTEKAHREVR
jgi:hypothetical protein